MDRPKGGRRLACPLLQQPPSPTPSSLLPPLELNCLGFLFVFALKIGATYARLFLASQSSLFGFFCCCFSLSLSCSSARFLCVHFVYFSRLVFCFFMLLLFSVVCFRDESCAGRPPISANTARCRRRGELCLWGLRTVA